MKTLKLLAFLSLVWVLAACGSVEDVRLEAAAPGCGPLYPPSVTCPWGSKIINGNPNNYDAVDDVAVGPDDSVYAIIDSHGKSNGSYYSHTYLRKYNKYGSVLWTTELSHGSQLEVDAQGNAYLLSYSYGFDGSLSKISPSGNQLWSISIPNTNVHDFTLNPQGQPMVLGSVYGKYDIYGYNASGTLVSYWGAYHSPGFITDIAIGSNYNIYLGGGNGAAGVRHTLLFVLNSSFTQIGSLLWEGYMTQDLVLDAQNNIFVLGFTSIEKITPALNIAWKITMNENTFTDLALDSSNNVYAVGTTGDNGNAVNTNALIQKFNASTGAVLWSTTWDLSNHRDHAKAVAISKAGGYLYVVGSGSYSNDQYSNDTDGFLLRYNSSGTQR